MAENPLQERTTKHGPPAGVAAVVAALTPRRFRDALALRLLSDYSSLPDYLYQAARGIARTTAAGAAEAFDRTRFIADLACVFIAFHDMHPVAPLAGVLVVSALILTWRDGYAYPPGPAAGEAVIDAIVLQVSLLGWSIVCQLFHSPFAPPVMEIVVEGLFLMGIFGGWRFAVYWKKQPGPSPTDAEIAYKAAKRINYLWYAAIWILAIANGLIVISTGTLLSLFFVAPTLILIQLAERLQSERTGNRFQQQSLTLTKDPRKQKRYDQSNRLFIKRLSWKNFTWATLAELLGWTSLAVPIVHTLIAWRLTYITTDQIDWLLLLGNCGIYVILATVWRELKTVNLKVFHALRADCES